MILYSVKLLKIPILKSLESIINEVAPGLTALNKTGASPDFLSHFLNLPLGESPASIYNHNFGRMPKKLVLGFGRIEFSIVVLIKFFFFFFILSTDSNFISAPV